MAADAEVEAADPSEHGAECVASFFAGEGYTDMRLALECACGHLASGRTWEEAGRKMDEHLAYPERDVPADGEDGSDAPGGSEGR